jgi:CubicO group peptidase (beta-lactamase class C family)
MDGVINGLGGLEMTPRDMAKFGYLYLKGGYWEGQQIVPRAWVEESTVGHIKIYGILAIIAPYYGYQWYIHPLYFHSFGYQGQYIFVIPKHEMAVAFTSGLTYRQYSFIPHLIEHYIIPSAKETKPILNNSKAEELLNSKIRKFNTGWRKE